MCTAYFLISGTCLTFGDLLLTQLLDRGSFNDLQVQSSVVVLAGQSSDQTMYKVSRKIKLPNYFTDVPCGVCPVTAQCCVGGIISPLTCEYMNQWLGMADGDVEDLLAGR